MSIKTLLPFLLLFTLSLSAQSGWVKEQGSGYAQLSATYLGSSNFFNLSGSPLTTTGYRSVALNAYIEYGLTDKFTVVLNGPLLKSQSFETTESTFGVGDIGIGVKYGIISGGEWPLSIHVAVEAPLSPQDQFARNDVQQIPGIIDQVNLPASDGEWNVRNTLALSHSWSSKLYSSVYGQYNLRTKNLTDQWQVGVELGYFPSPNLLVAAKLSTQATFGNPVQGISFVRGEGVSYTALGGMLQYTMGKGVSINATFTTYADWFNARKNLYSATVPGIGVAYEW